MRPILLSLVILLSLSVNAAKKDYDKGYYYDLSENKIEGYIYYKSGTFVKFRTEKDAKAIRLTPDSVKSFHINNMDYLVIRNFTVKYWGGSIGTHYDSAFAQVLVLGKINVYKYKLIVNNGMAYGFVELLIIGKGDDIVQVKQGGKKFRKQILPYISDNKKLAENIVSEKLNYNDLKRIVSIYNSN